MLGHGTSRLSVAHRKDDLRGERIGSRMIEKISAAKTNIAPEAS